MHREHLILIPGLGDRISLVEERLKKIFAPDVIIHFYRANWRNGENFDSKLQHFLNFFDGISEKNGTLSLGGISAGGSLVLNSYCERRTKVNKVINICGRLKAGKIVFPPLGLAAITSRSFYDSVRASGENLEAFTTADTSKFMTFSALFDEQVPRQTSQLEGAQNLIVPRVGHVFSQAYALTRMNREITKFILS